MNAAAASAHQHIHQPASAPAPQSVNGVQEAPSSGQSGFVDLINLLLGTEQTPTAIDPGMEADGKRQADAEQHSLPTLKTRSPQEIAAALVKSMSGRSMSTNAFSDRSSNKSPQRKQTDSSQNPVALVFSGAPVQTFAAAAQSISLANLPMPQTSRSIEPPQIKAGASEGGVNVPVAFALKLTPKEGASEDKTSAQPDTTGSQPETAGQSAGSAEQDKSDHQVFSIGAEELSAPKMRMPLETSSVSGEQMHSASPFVGSEPSGSPVRSPSPLIPAAPLNSADALRKSGIDAPEQVNPGGPAQEIAVRISRAEQAVDVHVTERGGQVHVAVRTPDIGLQTSLRQDLGTLVKSLDHAGYHAEASPPLSVSSTESSSSQMNGNNSQQQESGSNSGREWGGQQGRQQHQGQSKQTSQDWMEAMENAQ